MKPHIEMSKDINIFMSGGVDTRHCQDIEFSISGFKRVFASSNRDGYYFLKVVFGNHTTMFEVRILTGLVDNPPFYLWIKQMLEMAGLK